MNLDSSAEAEEYGRQALRAFESAGGDQLLQEAEAKPTTREALVGAVLNELGAWDPSRGPIPTASRPRRRCAAAPATGACPIRSPNGSPARSEATTTDWSSSPTRGPQRPSRGSNYVGPL